MALLPLNARCCFSLKRFSSLFSRLWCPSSKKKLDNVKSTQINSKNYVCNTLARQNSTGSDKFFINWDEDFMSQVSVTEEIRFFRDVRNNFTKDSFSNVEEPYGPPLAILLSSSNMNGNVLKKLIKVYGEKGFDVMTVYLSYKQMMFPCVAGGGMNVVTDLLEYLNECQKNRPYIFHGFSIGVYTYGELMAQFSDHYEKYRCLTNNVKGCLWDSPVDFLCARQCVGKFLHPKNMFLRWRCNMAVNRHFKQHHHDSVVYWLRSRDNLCNPIVRAPNVFFVSYTDPLSNPCNLQCLQKTLECNGIPIYQKTWWNSNHVCHFEKYCYEYLYGLVLFFNLSSLFPDECGKYYCSSSSASLANLRLSKKARDNYCQ